VNILKEEIQRHAEWGNPNGETHEVAPQEHADPMGEERDHNQ
jgi:hypothetical protein